MTYSFTRTREQIGSMVLRKLRRLGAAQTPSSGDLEIVYEAVDLRLKEMHRLGIFWRNVSSVPLSFTVTAAVNSASATADIAFPIALTIRDGSADEPVQIISKLAYAKIENKADTGLPTQALWNGGATFTFYPVALTTTTARLTYQSIADDTAASTAPDVDVAMMRWLKDIIAYDLGDEFGVPEARMNRWQKESIRAEINIRKLGVERVDYTEVAVDDFAPRSESRTKHDWNTA